MDPDSQTPAPALKASRERTVDALIRHFSDDRLSVDEYERRLDAAHRARTRDELERLLRDLPLLEGETRPVPAGAARAKPAEQETTQRAPAPRRPMDVEDRSSARDSVVLAIMGGAKRAGRWSPPPHLHAVSFWGGVTLDFRNAHLPREVTEVAAYAVMGGIEIIVPPGMRVENAGFALMGGFETDAVNDAPETASGPALRVTGFALMGGVEIKVREPK